MDMHCNGEKRKGRAVLLTGAENERIYLLLSSSRQQAEGDDIRTATAVTGSSYQGDDGRDLLRPPINYPFLGLV